MKKLFFVAVILLFQLNGWCQGIQIATLHHGDEFKSFYSANALIQALEEASEGDVINLSAGTFNGGTINVPIAIRGAGIGTLENFDNPSNAITNIVGKVILNIPNNYGSSLSMEGIVCKEIEVGEIYSPIFSKMKILKMSMKNGDVNFNIMDNMNFIHCIIEEINSSNQHNSSNTAYFQNCVIDGWVRDLGNYNGHASFYNCVILESSATYANYYDSRGYDYTNCIFDQTKVQNSFSQGILRNCLFVGNDKNTLSGDNANIESQNRILPADVNAFKEGTFYRLTPEASKYLGNDNTEVGIYGSSLPFSAKTSYPQIKKFVVSPESTSDGKLHIELEIDVVD